MIIDHPSVRDKRNQRFLIDPTEFSRAVWPGEHQARNLPRRAILTFRTDLCEYASGRLDTRTVEQCPLYRAIILDDETAVINCSSFGAPAAAVVLELLIARGVQSVVLLGSAGGIAEDATHGDIVLCADAWRDEGTSGHYLDSQLDKVDACTDIVKMLRLQLTKSQIAFREGSSWTTDALFRETMTEVSWFRQRGALCVEMEAAALFAVARARGINAAGIFVISDILAAGYWQPFFQHKSTPFTLQRVLDEIIEAFSESSSISQ